MKSGLWVVTNELVKLLTLDYIVWKLNECSDEQGSDCMGCSNLSICRKAFDRRADYGD